MKRVCVIGQTGHGKSSLLNSLCGDINNSKFETDSKEEGVTQFIVSRQEKWFDEKSEVVLIDTPGLGDTDEKDKSFVRQFLTDLKETHIHVFLVVINGQNPRNDQALKKVLRMIGEMFGASFRSHALIVVTRWGYDKKSKKSREKNKENEKSKAANINKVINEFFSEKKQNMEPVDEKKQNMVHVDEKKQNMGHVDEKKQNMEPVDEKKQNMEPVECVFIDNFCASYDKNDPEVKEERDKFEEALQKIRTFVDNATAYDCKQMISKDGKTIISRKPLLGCIRNEINEYFKKNFDQKELKTKSLSNDIYSILNNFDSKDQSYRISRGKYADTLLEELSKQLPNEIGIAMSSIVKLCLEKFQIQEGTGGKYEDTIIEQMLIILAESESWNKDLEKSLIGILTTAATSLLSIGAATTTTAPVATSVAMVSGSGSVATGGTVTTAAAAAKGAALVTSAAKGAAVAATFLLKSLIVGGGVGLSITAGVAYVSYWSRTKLIEEIISIIRNIIITSYNNQKSTEEKICDEIEKIVISTLQLPRG